MAVAARTIVDSFREAIQDLLVPELKALRVSMDSLRAEMLLRTDSVQKELQLREEGLRAEMRAGSKAMQDSVLVLSQKLDFAIDIREYPS